MAAIRLFTQSDLQQNAYVALSREQAHYLANVMRRKEGDVVRLFNGRQGEWSGKIVTLSKKHAEVLLIQHTKEQYSEPNIRLCFAPVKNAPQHFLVQKATELGVSILQPIITHHTIVSRVNSEKLRANVLEAAEQCERLSIPQVLEPITFESFIAGRDTESALIFCDETGGGESAITTLSSLPNCTFPTILIGPEGGFAEKELAQLRAAKSSVAIGLGPRILRADTAALAALTVVQATLGDWDKKPRFSVDEI